MRIIWIHRIVACALGLAALPAFAGMCQTPFMHDGGKVKLSGSGCSRWGPIFISKYAS